MTKDKLNPAPLWTKNLIIAAIVNFLIYFGFQMLQPTLPIYIKSLGANATYFTGFDSGIGVGSTIYGRKKSETG